MKLVHCLFSLFILMISTLTLADNVTLLFAVEPASVDGDNITLFPADVAISDSLMSWGYAVKTIDADEVNESTVIGMDIVLLSATSGNRVGTDFANVEIPIVVCEAAVYNRLKMSARAGKTVADQTTLSITMPEHPIVRGFQNDVQVTSTPSTFYYGELPDGASPIATIVGEPDMAAIFAYEQGEAMRSTLAPAKRVGFFLHDETFLNLNENGMTLVKSALTWALQPSPGDTLAPEPPSSLRVRNVRHNEIELSWRAASDNTSIAGYDIYVNDLLYLNTPSISVWIEDLIPETEYVFYIRARDGADNISEPSETLTVTTSARSETTPAPPVISVLDQSATTVLLGWQPVDISPMPFYDVYVDGTLYSSTRSTTALVAGLVPETKYGFYVKTRSEDGIRSEASAAVDATTTKRSVEPAHGESAVGTNLSGINDWSQNQPFINMAKTMRQWGNESQSGMDVDENGYLRSIDNTSRSDEEVSYFLFDIPAGNYILDWEGEGRVEYSGGSKSVVEQSDNHILYKFNASNNGQLVLRETDPNGNGNYLHNIRFYQEKYKDIVDTQIWDPEWLDLWKDFSVFRFMDWQSTNGNTTIQKWSNRRPPSAMTQSSYRDGRGLSIEYLVDVCNLSGKDAWFCVPHMATDDYVRHLARYVAKYLDPSLKVFIEHSNEVWNSGFAQHDYAAQQGASKLNVSGDHWVTSASWHAYRSMQIFDIFEQEVGLDRTVRVMSGWINTFGNFDQVALTYNNAFKKTDVFAIAYYYGHNMQASSVNDVFNKLPAELAGAKQQTVAIRNLINRYNPAIELISYEGGQHLVDSGNASLTTILIAANRDPRMGGIYTTMLNDWKSAGGTLFCNFSSIAEASKWGCWGIIEDRFKDLGTAYKYQSYLDWIPKNPIWWYDKKFDSNDPSVGVSKNEAIPVEYALQFNYPNPFNPSTTISYSVPNPTHVSLVIYDIHGREVRRLVDRQVNEGIHSVQWDGRNNSDHKAASGIYFYRLTTEHFVDTKRMLLIK